MPSETMDFKSLSSSLYSSEDICASNERQVGFWESDNPPKCYGSSLNVQPASNFSESSEVNIIATHHESSLFSSSLSELFSTKLRLSANNALYGHSVDTIASHYEEEWLSKSLEELEAQTIGDLLPNDDDLLSGMTDGLNHIVQDSTGDDMEELDLFSSVGGMDLGDDSTTSGKKNSEFVGGTCKSQLGVFNGSIVGENPYSEPPSRTLFVRNVNINVEDSELKDLFEQFGDIHTLHTACKHRGFVMISYYDIRSAQNAMRTLRNRLLSCRKIDIHYKDNPSEKDINLGSLVVFDHDLSVSNDELRHIFNVYGEIKEICENPQSRHHKLIEFYDVRAAEAALHASNRNDIAGKRIKVEASQAGASKCCSVVQQIHPEEQKECSLYLRHNSPPLKSPITFPGPGLPGVINSGTMDGGRILGVEPAVSASSLETDFIHGISSSVSNTLPSRVRFKSVGNQCGITETSSPGQLNFDIHTASTFHPHSVPEFHDGLVHGVHRNPPEVADNINLKTQERIDNIQFCGLNSNGHSMEFNECVSESAGNGSCPLPGHHYKWSNSYQPSGMMWPNSPSYFDGICAAPTLPRLHGLPRSPTHMMSTLLPINNQHVSSNPAVSSSLWDIQHTYAVESPEASAFCPGSVGNMRFSSNTPQCGGFVSHNIFPRFGGNYVDLPIHPKSVGLQSHNQMGLMFPGRNHMIPTINPFVTHKERARSRRNEGGSNLADKKQYELDIDRIKSGEDNRTTLMIKNIPNKYTSKMLLAAIDERHKGTYDFFYLPIDFKNKCNVGYAFINMSHPSVIIPFYQVFNGKKWEKFNSEKVASLAYARIQGKAALIAHFQNSSLMNEDKRCRPILFNTDGPNAGDQAPFPVGVNVRTKPARVRNHTLDDNVQGSTPNLGNSELAYDGESISKESD